MALFEEFLRRNRQQIAVHYARRTQPLPSSLGMFDVQDQHLASVDFLTGLMLTVIKPRDPQSEAMRARAMDMGMSKETVIAYIMAFVDGVEAACAEDTTLSDSQRQHFAVMIGQSRKFFMLVVVNGYRGPADTPA